MTAAAGEATLYELRNTRRGRAVEHATITKGEAALRNKALRGLSLKWQPCQCPTPPNPTDQPPKGRRELPDDE